MLPVYRTKLSVFNYDEIPPGYYHQAMLEGSRVQQFWHREKFREISERIWPGERVLDLGCGPGSFLWVLGNEHPDVSAVGVDIASSQIEYARQHVEKAFPGRIRFESFPEHDPKLPFEDGTFDVVTSIEVLEHIHPYLSMQALAEARRLLKPDGRLIVTTPNYRSFWPLLEAVLEKVSRVKYHDQHISQFTPNSFTRLVEAAGFAVTDFNTLFVVAPFLAGISERLARRVRGWERNLPFHVGSLMVIEAGVWHPQGLAAPTKEARESQPPGLLETVPV